MVFYGFYGYQWLVYGFLLFLWFSMIILSSGHGPLQDSDVMSEVQYI